MIRFFKTQNSGHQSILKYYFWTEISTLKFWTYGNPNVLANQWDDWAWTCATGDWSWNSWGCAG